MRKRIALSALGLCLLLSITYTWIVRKQPMIAELTSVLNQNTDSFQRAANALAAPSSIVSIERGGTASGTARPDFFFVESPDGRTRLVSRAPLTSELVEEVLNSGAGDVLAKLGFLRILRSGNSVYFVKASEPGRFWSLVYVPEGDPTSQYILKVQKLRDHWYYVEER
jgi:hypothetical protein